jgi:thiaminase (transcriptional activator TenA)
MELSEIAWKKSYQVYEAFLDLDFMKDLMDGTLLMSIFSYSMEQDYVYILREARVESAIASEINQEYMDDFISYSNSSLAYLKIVDAFFVTSNETRTGNLTAATIDYSNHIASRDSYAETVAALVPCFVFYAKAAEEMEKNMSANNPYEQWFDSYTSASFKAETNRLVDIFNDLANKATEVVREKMVDAYYESAIKEVNFYNDIYAMRYYDEAF